MNLDTYQELTGLAVKDADRSFVAASIKKAQFALEGVLGFPLLAEDASQNLYTELGKAPSDTWICGGSDADLLPPDDDTDEVYRVFDYEPGTRTHIDPCSSISKVKLVHGDVTVHTYESDEWAALQRNGFCRMVDLVRIFTCTCDHPIQVAVSADWLGMNDEDEQSTLPNVIQGVWADLASHLSDRSRNIKSENLGTRSYTKFEVKSPLDDSAAILAQYAGPRGTAGRLPV